MFVKLCALLIVFAAVTANAAPSNLRRKIRDTGAENVQVSDSEWEGFKTKFNKTYKDEAEEAERRAIYLDTKKFVEAHNKEYEAGKKSFTVGINHFADLKPEERRHRNGLIRPKDRNA